MTPLASYTSDHRLLVEAVTAATGITDPVAFTTGTYFRALVDGATRGPLVPIENALIRDWSGSRNTWPGTQFGIRLYTVEGIPFARCFAGVNTTLPGYDFFVT